MSDVKLLRSYIKNFLFESLEAPEITSIACLKDDSTVNTQIVLFKFDTLYREMSKSRGSKSFIDFIYSAFEKSVVGYGSFGPPEKGEAMGAWEVYNAAGAGYGKIIYGVGYALSPSGLLVPDRQTVSPSASKSWRKAAGERKKYKLDDFPPDNRTEDSFDDAELHKEPGSDHLNYAYAAVGWEKTMVKKLFRMGDAAVEEVFQVLDGKLTRDVIKKIFVKIGQEFFVSSYKKSVDFS